MTTITTMKASAARRDTKNGDNPDAKDDGDGSDEKDKDHEQWETT